MIRIGILGCGKIAQVRHIPEYAAHPDCRLTAFWSPTRSRAEAMAGIYGGKVCDTAEELLREPDIDAVSVCTANCAHAELTIRALQAGKHVLCEKPMAVTMEECLAMVRTAEEHHRMLMIAWNQRMEPTHREAARLLRQGVIGEILSFRTAFGHAGPEHWAIRPGQDVWFFDRERAVLGVMGDLGVHKLDLIRYLTGQDVVRVSARFATLEKRGPGGEKIGLEDNAFCVLELSGGAVGTLTASWTFHGAEDNSTVLYGTEGVMRICDDPDNAIRVCRSDGTEQVWDGEPAMTNARQSVSGVIDDWIDCLKTGREPACSGREALPVMRALFACTESARTGYPAEIPENRQPEESLPAGE